MTSGVTMALSLLGFTMVYVVTYFSLVALVLYIIGLVFIKIFKPVIKFIEHK